MALRLATADAIDEYGSTSDVDITLGNIFASEPIPISEVVLRQLIPMTPTRRYFSLIATLWHAWGRNHHGTPAWLAREYAYMFWARGDEYRAWQESGVVEKDLRPEGTT